MFRIIAFVALLCAATTLAQAQSTPDFTQTLRSIHLDPGFRQGLRERGYTGKKFEVMVDHTRLLYADRAIMTGIARKIDEGLRASGNRPNRAFFARLDQALNVAYNTGLTRLSGAERRRLFTTDFAYINALPSRECTRLLTGRLPPERAAELFDKFMVQLSAAQIAEYHRVLRKATRLGLARGATPRSLSAAEVRRVEEAVFPTVDTLIGKQKNAKALYKAWRDGPRGTQRYVCTFRKLFAASAQGIQGSTGDLAVLWMMTQ
ncbi:hypothetical protein AIOL_000490 [Candidatus Rhodobacter oscarellae]|uniref:Uncharacterized protein n=1 Tax=Candidatus Rhodobacter oscarellae TaxID=1675527 RepID=A0A0J9EC38_9RHOB|nr:hypothetical protein [Candidatus Rhodobacter lobularis]KMW60337.1 hypothetical protein AIOL_000490 [Candidatus Rhodobacter lobularis]